VVSLEIADVAIYLIRLADVLGVDLARVIDEKIWSCPGSVDGLAVRF
jgi:NTP pyrophosphatase (non-canonical NTP hydrolase)